MAMHEAVSKKNILINAILFQCCWFAAILLGWVVAIIPLAAMLVHYFLIMGGRGLLLVLLLSVIGMMFDSLYLYLSIYQFNPASAVLPILGIPLFLVCLWVGFCLTLPVSLAWLVQKPRYFLSLCVIFGPLSYLAGRRLGALEFSNNDLVFLFIEWMIMAVFMLLLLLPLFGSQPAVDSRCRSR